MSDDFDALLDAAVKRKVTSAETETVDVLVGDKVVTLRFTEMDALEWANVTAACPMRATAPLDRNYGYNVDSATRLAAPLCGVRVDGDIESPLSEDQWKKLFLAVSGHEQKRITDALFMLNEFGPQQRLAKAKKALTPAPAKKRNLPAS